MNNKLVADEPHSAPRDFAQAQAKEPEYADLDGIFGYNRLISYNIHPRRVAQQLVRMSLPFICKYMNLKNAI